MLTPYTLQMPKLIYGGENALAQMSGILKPVKKAAFFTDKGIVNAGLLKLPVEQVKKSGKDFVIFDDLAAEPTCEQAQAVVDAFRASGADFIIAVGGGSVMDTAKLASVLATGEYGIRELLEHPEMARKGVRTIMIPTTAGTGSEATPNAIV